MAATHVLWMLVVLREKGENLVTLSRLLDHVHSTGRDNWTASQLRSYIEQLVRNQCVEWADIPDSSEPNAPIVLPPA
jgi:hypothetical protein